MGTSAVHLSFLTTTTTMDTLYLAAIAFVIVAIAAFMLMSGSKSGDNQAESDSGGAKMSEAAIKEMDARVVKNIPSLSINAGPRDPDWQKRVMEEMVALTEYVKKSKSSDEDW